MSGDMQEAAGAPAVRPNCRPVPPGEKQKYLRGQGAVPGKKPRGTGFLLSEEKK